MPQYFSPGVYVEEVDSGPRPIQGVSTSVTGAVGVTSRGPSNDKPVLITSYSEFVRIFGGPLDDPSAPIQNQWNLDQAEGGRWWQFALTIKGFFDNGGQQLFVKRVTSRDAGTALVICGKGVMTELTEDVAVGSTVIRLRNLLGVQVGATLTLYANGQPLSDTFFVLSYGESGDVTLNVPVPRELEGGRDFALVQSLAAVSAATPDPRLRIQAYSSGVWGGVGDRANGLSVRISPMVSSTLNLLTDPTGNATVGSTTLTTPVPAGTNSLTVGSISGFSQGQSVSIRGQLFVLSTVPNVPNTSTAGAVASGETVIPVKDPTVFSNSNTVAINRAVYTLSNVDAGAKTTVNAVAAGDAKTITFQAVAGFADGNVVQIDGQSYTLSNGTATGFDISPSVPAAASWAVGEQILRVPRTVTISPAALTPWPLDTEIRFLQPQTTTIGATPPTGGATTVELADVAGILAGSVVEIDFDQYVVNSVDTAANTVTVSPPVPNVAAWTATTVVRLLPNTMQITPGAPGDWAVGTGIRSVRPANSPSNPTDTVNVQGASVLYRGAILEFDNGTQKQVLRVTAVAGSVVSLSGSVTIPLLENQKVRLIEANVGARYLRDGAIEADEQFTNLRLVDDGSFSYIARNINDRSNLIRIVPGDAFDVGSLTDFPSVPAASGGAEQRLWIPLNGGDDRLDSLTIDDFVGVDGGSGNRTGVQSLEDIDDISLVVVPGMWSGTIRDAVVRHCEAMRYRFAIIDPPPEFGIQDVRAFRAPIDSRFAGMYYPWIVVRNAAQQRFDTVAPSATMAGLYSRVDGTRGFHKAPANEVISGIRQPNPVAQTGGIERDITRREQDLLNPEGINALRYFPGRGQRVWGARTLSSDSNWKYINVRRIFTFIEKSIDEGTQWVVFEPNDQQLWARVRQTIRNFLETQWRNGVLEGKTAEEAFFVACDRGVTMSQDDVENGRLICEVGIAPVFPAEFVIFRISKFTAESKLS